MTYDIYAIANPDEYPMAICCVSDGTLFTFCDSDDLHFLEPKFENDHDLGTFICKASSLDELKLLHPELFL